MVYLYLARGAMVYGDRSHGVTIPLVTSHRRDFLVAAFDRHNMYVGHASCRRHFSIAAFDRHNTYVGHMLHPENIIRLQPSIDTIRTWDMHNAFQFYITVGWLRRTKFCWVGKHINIIMKPTNSSTQGQTNPRKNRLKVVLGPLFSHSK